MTTLWQPHTEACASGEKAPDPHFHLAQEGQGGCGQGSMRKEARESSGRQGPTPRKAQQMPTALPLRNVGPSAVHLGIHWTLRRPRKWTSSAGHIHAHVKHTWWEGQTSYKKHHGWHCDTKTLLPFVPSGTLFWTTHFIQNSLVITNDLHFTSVKYPKPISFSAKKSHLPKYWRFSITCCREKIRQ